MAIARPFRVMICAALFGAALSSPVAAWTPRTQVLIGENAASIAPPDLARQITRHSEPFRQGILEPFSGAPQGAHVKNPDGRGSLDASILQAVDSAIGAIRGHRPFSEVVFQLGVVAHYVADAGNPLNTSDLDPSEPSYFSDYLRYVEAAQERYPVVFYSDGRDLTSRNDLELMLETSLSRGRQLYPMIGREYQRIGRVAGLELFDDRSTAFGAGSVALSHAVSDVAAVMRYIWLQAGGGDDRRIGLTKPRAHAGEQLDSR